MDAQMNQNSRVLGRTVWWDGWDGCNGCDGEKDPCPRRTLLCGDGDDGDRLDGDAAAQEEGCCTCSKLATCVAYQ